MASTLNASSPLPLMDRRQNAGNSPAPTRGYERRQFADNYDTLSSGARELALAMDAYKLRHRRRFITHDEIYQVMLSLGYRKIDNPVSG